MNGIDVAKIVDTGYAAAQFAREPDVVLGFLFGSVARGRADALSDVDFAILLERGLTPEARLDVQLRLLGALASCSSREVQVTLLNGAPPLLAYRVVEEGLLLYARSEAEHADFVSLTRRVYFDWSSWEDYHTAALLRRIQEGGLSGRRQSRGRALEAARRIHRRLARDGGR